MNATATTNTAPNVALWEPGEIDIRDTIKDKLLAHIDGCEVGTGAQREAMRAFAEFCMALETEVRSQRGTQETAS